MWRKNRSSRSNRNNNNKRGPPKKKVVGTEAAAQKNLERNQKNFHYPAAGFATPIEHTLLYAMLNSPDIYPEAVVKDHIRDEDFNEYLLVNHQKSATTNSSSSKNQQGQEEEEELHSYAQLSALLNLASEKYPPPSSPCDNNGDTAEQQREKNKNSIPQILCRALLQTVVRHAEEHCLDRESEVHELLQPLARLTERKDVQQTATILLPTYIGLGVSMLTANPLPLYLGWAVGAGTAVNDTDFQNQAGNLQQLQSTTNRVADVEKTSLLDETDE